jgi:hypothetical protein
VNYLGYIPLILQGTGQIMICCSYFVFAIHLFLNKIPEIIDTTFHCTAQPQNMHAEQSLFAA